jgi:YbdK family carboxylate-amine ligase
MGVAFTPSQRRSVGVEWELQIVDLATRELAPAGADLLADLELSNGRPNPKVKPELLQCTVEVITGICQTIAEARADLAATVRQVAAVARDHNYGLLCAGTHPFSHWADQKITDEPRYEQLVEQLQWIARRYQIFGVHVHVGVTAKERMIPIVNGISEYIPHFLALSASSPYWVGYDTGLASARIKVFDGLPRAGLPYQLSGWTEYEDMMATLLTARAIDTVREVWWDVRPHPDLGTVELRIWDGLPTLDEITVVAALSQSLVERLDEQYVQGDLTEPPQTWLLRENKWRATRYGLDAELIVDETGATMPVRQALRDLVGELMPFALRLGCADELRGIDRILTAGASYQRQRAVAAASGGDLTRVVDSLLEEMALGLQ